MSRGRTIAVSMAFAVALLLVASQLWGHRSAEVTRLESQRADVETQLRLAQRSLNRAEEFAEGGEESAAELEAARAAFPPGSDLGTFVTVNAAAAAESGVEVLAVVPEAAGDEVDGGVTDKVRTPLEVTVRGPEQAVADYVRALGELPRLTVIEDVQLTAEGGGLTSAALGVAVYSQ